MSAAWASSQELVDKNIETYKKLEALQNEEFQKLVFQISPKQINSSRAFKFVIRDQLGRDWLFKSGAASSGDGALAVFRISQMLGIASPEVHHKILTVNGVSIVGAVQRVMENVEGFSGDWGALNDGGRDYVVKNHLLSWLVANHHIHHDQFLISKDKASKNPLTKIDNSINWALLGNDSLDIQYRSPMLNHSPFAGYYEFWKEYLYSGKRFKKLMDENKFAFGNINDFDLNLQDNLNLAKYVSQIPNKYYSSFFEQSIKNGLLYAGNNEAISVAWLTPAQFIESDKTSFLSKILARKNGFYRDFEKFYMHLQSLRGDQGLKTTNEKDLKKTAENLRIYYESLIETHQNNLKAIEKVGSLEQKNIENFSSIGMYRIATRLGEALRFNQKSQLLDLINELKKEFDKYEARNSVEKESLTNAQENLLELKKFVESKKYQKIFFFWLALHTNQFFEKDYIKTRVENNPFRFID